MTKIFNIGRTCCRIVELGLHKIKKGFQNFLVEWYFWHPTLAFIFIMDSMMDCIKKAHTDKESFQLFFVFFGFNALFNALWSYRRHLVNIRKEEKSKKERW